MPRPYGNGNKAYDSLCLRSCLLESIYCKGDLENQEDRLSHLMDCPVDVQVHNGLIVRVAMVSGMAAVDGPNSTGSLSAQVV